jgi:DNA-binding transcriptional MocR family regulator
MSQELTGPHAPYMLIVYMLADKIKSGELKPGDRLPSVTELAETYAVSHSTARRALAKLKEMGLTDTCPATPRSSDFPTRHHGLLPRADGTLRSPPGSQGSAVQKHEEISKCRRR